jgi:periplasmic divalent cation tolerance protein
MADEFIQVVTTTGTQAEARKIAQSLVEERLAACVQIVGPIESTYRWQEKIETAAEWQCWCKTRRSKYDAVVGVIRQLNTYDVPEILVLPIIDGSEAYLHWLAQETS